MNKTLHSSLLVVASLAVIAFATTPASAAKMKGVDANEALSAERWVNAPRT